MRLIDADALRDYAFEIYQGNGVELETLMVVPLREINNAPTVAAISTELHEKIRDKLIRSNLRPQGEWIRYRDNPHQPEHIKCSNCGQYWSVADHDKTFDFCFKCGAYMRKRDKHETDN